MAVELRLARRRRRSPLVSSADTRPGHRHLPGTLRRTGPRQQLLVAIDQRRAIPQQHPVVQHHPALPYTEASQFILVLSSAAGIAAAMLRFLIFTACRTNEVVGARWSEIDRPSSTWRIPGERMKMHQDHVVPLSDPALAILDKMRGGQRELIFPNPEGGAFSENAMLAVLDRLGHGHVTVHGFRSTFAT